MDLIKKQCVPCEGGEPVLTAEEIANLQPQLPDWKVTTVKDHPVLQKTFTLKDFVGAIDFINKIKDIAEAEGHHPDLHVHWNKVRVENWTHAIGGLHQNDFILAAKINTIPSAGR